MSELQMNEKNKKSLNFAKLFVGFVCSFALMGAGVCFVVNSQHKQQTGFVMGEQNASSTNSPILIEPTSPTEVGTNGTWSGSGTQASPYQIADATDLSLLATRINSSETNATYKSCYYKLTANITVESWIPIGTEALYFSGNFDGNNNKITISSLASSSGDYVGLFGMNSGNIKNLTVSGTISGVDYVGGIAGYNAGTIENTVYTGTVASSGNYVGGIVGANNGVIKTCFASGGNITATGGSAIAVGGIAGINLACAQISNCGSVGGAITAHGYQCVGGIVGINNGQLLNAYNTKSVTANSKSVTFSSETTTVKGVNVGGVVGQNCGTVQNVYNSSTVTGTTNAYGGIGLNNGGNVTNCWCNSNPDANSSAFSSTSTLLTNLNTWQNLHTAFLEWGTGSDNNPTFLFNLSFDVQSGTGGTTATNATIGASMPSITLPTRTGYNFLGYFTETGGNGTMCYDSSGASAITWCIANNITLYANWIQNQVQITIQKDGSNWSGSGKQISLMGSTNYAYGSATVSGATVTWSAVVAGTYSIYADSVDTGNDVTVTSGLASATVSYYTLSGSAYYNSSSSSATTGTSGTTGGTVSADVIVLSGKTGQLTATAQTGYSFVGWFSSSTFTGTALSTSTTYTSPAMTQAATYYAFFRVISYTLTLTAGTGISSVSGGGTYVYGQSVAISAGVSTGYTWSTWSVTVGTTPSTFTASTQNQTIVMANGNVTLTASATANSYNISYVYNGGSAGSKAPTSGTYNSVVEISNPTKTGYTFAGWTASGDFNTSTAKYIVNSAETSWSSASTAQTATQFKNLSTTSGGTVTLTATWSEIIYNISYNYADGTKGSLNPASAKFDATVEISNPTKTGYTFTGWTASGDFNTSTAKYFVNSTETSWSNASTAQTATQFKNLSTTNGGTVTLTATWNAIDVNYSVEHYLQKVDLSGYTLDGSAETKQAKTGSTINVSDVAKSYTGFSVKNSSDYITVKADGSSVLKCYYDRNTYSITLNAGAGIKNVTLDGTTNASNSTSVSKSFVYGKTGIAISATLTDSRYTFESWSGTATITSISTTLSISSTSDQTYTANAYITIDSKLQLAFGTGNNANKVYVTGYTGANALFDLVIPETVGHDGTNFVTGSTYPVVGINDQAFYGNMHLQKIVIPSSITTIGEMALANCPALATIEILSTDFDVGSYAFSTSSQSSISKTLYINAAGKMANIAESALSSHSVSGLDDYGNMLVGVDTLYIESSITTLSGHITNLFTQDGTATLYGVTYKKYVRNTASTSEDELEIGEAITSLSSFFTINQVAQIGNNADENDVDYYWYHRAIRGEDDYEKDLLESEE